MVDEATKLSLAKIPLLKTKAGPRDGELWISRLKEEYQALIKVLVKKIGVSLDTKSLIERLVLMVLAVIRLDI